MLLPLLHVAPRQGFQVTCHLHRASLKCRRSRPRHSLYEVVPGHTDGTSLLIQCYLVTRLVPAIWHPPLLPHMTPRRHHSPSIPPHTLPPATTSSTCCARRPQTPQRSRSSWSSRACMGDRAALLASPSTDTFPLPSFLSQFLSPSTFSGTSCYRRRFLFHLHLMVASQQNERVFQRKQPPPSRFHAARYFPLIFFWHFFAVPRPLKRRVRQGAAQAGAPSTGAADGYRSVRPPPPSPRQLPSRPCCSGRQADGATHIWIRVRAIFKRKSHDPVRSSTSSASLEMGDLAEGDRSPLSPVRRQDSSSYVAEDDV